ncbi:MAG: hypothetical protein AABZ23_02485 [Deltaproteobacteria bacterium]
MTIPFNPSLRPSKNDILISALSGLGFAFVLVWRLYPSMSFGQEYKDLIVGSIAWQDYDKDREWMALNLLVAFTVFFSAFFYLFLRRLKKKGLDIALLENVRFVLALAWVPALFWLGGAFMLPNIPSFFLDVSGVLVILTVLTVLGVLRYGPELKPEDLPQIWYSVFLTPVLAAFSSQAVLVAGDMFGLFTDAGFLGKHAGDIDGCAALVASVISFFFIFSSSTLTRLKNRLFYLKIILQAALPLLLLVFTSRDYLFDGRVERMYFSRPAVAAVFALTGLSWLMLFRAIRKRLTENEAPFSALSALSASALYPIAIYLSWSQFGAWAMNIGYDDFHLGEQLIPWQQVFEFGKTPYVDFAPIHGLTSLSYGFINDFFYDGTVATFPFAVMAMAAVAVALAFVSVFFYAGPVAALMLTPFTGVIWDRLMFFVPAVLLMLNPRLIARGRLWLVVWPFAVALSMFLNTAVGSGVVIGTIPLFVYMLWKADRQWLKYYIAATAGFTVLMLIIPQTRRMISGYIHFVLDNASTNTIANAVGIFQAAYSPQGYGLGAVPFQWNALRLSWILAAFVSVVFFLQMRRDDKEASRRDLWLSALLPIMLFVIGKWALNRVDATLLSRTGNLSYIAIAVFLPIMLSGMFVKRPLNSRGILISALIAGLMLVAASFQHPQYKVWFARPFAPEPVGGDISLVDGEDIGMPRIGRVFAQKARIEELKRVKAAVSGYLGPEETFLDLTNRSALYFFLDKPVPVLYSADYVPANHASHESMLRQIRQVMPAVVLAHPRIPHDGGPASLRSYVIYRELIDNYIPERADEYILLLRPDKVQAAKKPAKEPAIELLDAVFRAAELQAIPNVWGRSWNKLKKRFTVLGSIKPGALYNFKEEAAGAYAPVGPDPRISLGIEGLGFKGRDIDYILLEYSCVGKQGNPVLELYWSTDMEQMSEKTVVRFNGNGKKALIPVGAQPRWRIAGLIKDMRIDLGDPNTCKTLNIGNVSLLKLN